MLQPLQGGFPVGLDIQTGNPKNKSVFDGTGLR
jgi:hypothetical protein